MNVWRRPYRVGIGRWIVGGWEAAALVFLHRITVDLYHVPPGWLAVALAALWAALCVRLVVMGVFVGPSGIRIRGLFATRTIGWRSVERIVVERAGHRLFGFDIPAGRTAVIERRDGTRVNSSLWADGVDFKFKPARFREACAQLRREHELAAAALRPAPVPVGATGGAGSFPTPPSAPPR